MAVHGEARPCQTFMQMFFSTLFFILGIVFDYGGMLQNEDCRKTKI
jgi:hypothetical protein